MNEEHNKENASEIEAVADSDNKISYQDAIESFNKNYNRVKGHIDSMLGEDSQNYVKAYGAMTLLDQITHDEFMALKNNDIGYVVKRGQEIVKELGFNPGDGSFLQKMRSNKQLIEQLKINNNNDNEEIADLPDLKSSNTIVERDIDNLTLFSGR